MKGGETRGKRGFFLIKEKKASTSGILIHSRSNHRSYCAGECRCVSRLAVHNTYADFDTPIHHLTEDNAE